MEEKVYFNAGDCVRLRLHNLMQSPIMLVVRKESAIFKDDITIKGIRCRWFTDSNLMQEAVFNFKDLEKVTE